MTSGIIPEVISRWDGVEEMTRRLAHAGFKLPEWFYGFSAPIAGASKEEWHEYLTSCGRGFVRSGGVVDRESEMQGRFGRVYQELIFNDEVRTRFAVERSQWLQREAVTDEELEAGWSERARHLRVVAQSVAKKRGFKVTRKGFELRSGSGFVLRVEVDVGRPGSTRSQVIMYNRLETEDGRWGMWLPWSYVLKTAEFYMNGDTPTLLTWNIRAHIEACSAFMATLDSV